MDIVVKGRNVEIPDHYRVHVEQKLTRLERYDRKVIRFDVELFHEPNRRQAKNCQRVEITGVGKGPAVRAEACAGDFYAALDAAVSKLENRLRRQHDRRRVHYGRRSPASVAEATSVSAAAATRADAITAASNGSGPLTRSGSNGRVAAQTALLARWEPDNRDSSQDVSGDTPEVPEQRWDFDDNLPGRIVREKTHPSAPMTVDQALYEMELVGHDFYLFNDTDSGKPSVVYRRRGFDYGVIRLS